MRNEPENPQNWLKVLVFLTRPFSPQPKLYKSVIDDVINEVRELFLDEGVDEQVLLELKTVRLSGIVFFPCKHSPQVGKIRTEMHRRCCPEGSKLPHQRFQAHIY